MDNLHPGYKPEQKKINVVPKLKQRSQTFKTEGQSSVGDDILNELEEKEIELQEAKKLIFKLQSKSVGEVKHHRDEELLKLQ